MSVKPLNPQLSNGRPEPRANQPEAAGPLTPSPLEAALMTSGVVLPMPYMTLSARAMRDLPLASVMALRRFEAEARSELAALSAMLDAGLEMRYGECARAQLLADGRDTGTTHIVDGDIDVTVEIGKDIKWDQAALKLLARRIAGGGEDPAQYIDVKYAVAERKYAAWPDTIRSAFTPARTVTPKSPKFSLRRVGEGA